MIGGRPEYDKRRPRPESGAATNINRFRIPDERPVERLLERLERVRRSGKAWVASCPGPDHGRGDRNPSLSVREADDGTVLLNCFAGCTASEITQAVGLGLRDLFPPRADDWRPTPRPKPKPVAEAIVRALASRQEFALEWMAAGLLAALPPKLAQRDLLAAWDWLVERGADPSLVWRLAKLVRGVATFTYGRTCEPEDIERAVKRLLSQAGSEAGVVA